ncbi:phage tail tape measure protein [Mesorhizobium sp. NBSH29]|uniref:phage tail tape measure protein n=1 Tax=Mesorhizobium sp. NBSH29 TaxID=2654249 RepID=UPI001896A040|nr:phage tail tape measure protein [Mesorhizobium sp. NBSH29]QPC87149.1 phage tail tape measure protein [Mesorhizobium sp. NBSH29]
MADMGRNFRRHASQMAAVSAPLAVGLGAAAKAVYDYEKAGNRMEAFGLLSDDQRKKLEEEAQALNKFFPQTNKGIIEAAGELFRAGLTYEQSMGALKGSLQLALAGDIDTQRAADISTNIMYAMKMPMKTYEQVQASLQRINDLLAYGATKSNTDIQLMGDTFRYVAPLAAVAGMSIEEVTALTMELAKAGIKGSEAGVALRSALVRMAKPTKPMLAAFTRLGISMKDFVRYKDKIDASTITGSLLAEGYDVSNLTKSIQGILNDKALASAPERMVAELSDLIVGQIGDESVRDNVSQALTDAVSAGAQDVDLRKLLGVLKDKGATITDIAQIFDVRMGSRLAAILYSDLDGVVDDVITHSEGTADEMARRMTKGIVGVVLEMSAAVENFAITLADSGVLNTVTSLIDKFTSFVTELSKANPKMLEMGTYGVMALAAMAPLGLVISGLAASMALLANPLTLVVAGLGYLAYQNWDSLIAFGDGFKLGFLDNLDPAALEALGTFATNIQAWMGNIKTALADSEGMGATGEWFGASMASSINNLVSSIQRLKGELQSMREWWGNFNKEMNRPLGDVMYDHFMPDVWKPEKPTPQPGEVGYQVDTSGYESEVRTLAAEAKNTLSVTATPIVDTSSINAAIGRASALRQMLSGMDALGSRSSYVPKNDLKFGGPRAKGGPVQSGLTYLVGEEGPELFSPGRSGGITPNRQMAGNSNSTAANQNITFNISGGDPQAVAREVLAIMDRQLDRSRQTSIDGRSVV